jgi:hypothetical protein
MNLLTIFDDADDQLVSTGREDLHGLAACLKLVRAAVAELIAADREYDAAKAHRIEADNRITRGERSDDAFRQQANAVHAYDRAVERRRLALARAGGGA